MTFEELLKACASGQMPRVELTGDHKHVPKGMRGYVVTIKYKDRHKGIAVRFDNGPSYDCWFHYGPMETDKRSNYMHQLKLVNP
jgi:hypothetical protein